MKKVVLFFYTVACAMQVMAQVTLPDPTLKIDFEAQVKSMDEFMARFNGTESKPGVKQDENNRRNNLISLFDSKMNRGGASHDEFQKTVLDFIQRVVEWPQSLTLKEAGAWGEAICKMKYKSKTISVTLLMQLESIDKDRSRWGIAGVKGLYAAGLYSDKLATISPVDHETHFMSLQDFFQSNHSLAPSLRTKGKEVDELSLLMGLCMAGAIKFEQVDTLRFHFVDVPGFVFVVEEIARKGTNSGWLITQLMRKTDKEKVQYINNLFGIRTSKQ